MERVSFHFKSIEINSSSIFSNINFFNDLQFSYFLRDLFLYHANILRNYFI